MFITSSSHGSSDPSTDAGCADVRAGRSTTGSGAAQLPLSECARLDITRLRQQVLANGYFPLPNVSKTTFLKNWPNIAVTAEEIDRWRRRHSRWPDTGLRVQGGLAVIDFDINHVLSKQVFEAVEREVPALAGALIRFGKGTKEAWFVRTADRFGRAASHRFTAPGENVDEHGTHLVEIFGGGSSRQFGAFGAHTRSATGEVLVEYVWADSRSPANVPLIELPQLSRSDFSKVVDVGERELRAAGFVQVTNSKHPGNKARRQYDLTDDMVFETDEGFDAVPLATLETWVRAGIKNVRVSASFIEPGRLHSRTRCLVGRTRSGALYIWDSATGVTHFKAPRSFDFAALNARFGQLREARNV